MTLITLVEWWNLIYVVPFGLALLYLALFVFTGITFGHGDADFDGEADLDADVDADADVSVHVEAHVVEADGEVDADADHDVAPGRMGLIRAEAGGEHAHGSVDHPGSWVGDMLSFLGIGKIPLSLALMILLLLWGMVGFALNVMLVQWMGASSVVGFITLPVTAVVSIALTGACAALIAKVIPLKDGPSQRREDLVGRAGDAIYDIDSTFGMASVRTPAGELFQVPCQTADAKTRIPKGSRVVLFRYDREKGVFHVAPFAN